MKKKQELWDKKQEDTCGYCAYAKRMADDEHIICTKKNNIFEFNHSCRKFTFDIIKKNVRRKKMPDFSKFSVENFEL